MLLRTLLPFLLLVDSTSAFAADTPSPKAALSEQAKISALLDALETSDVTFIRNGTAMSGKDARKHLQGKLDELSGQVHTANDFITKVATQSRETGKPYMIREKDGKEVPSADWFKYKMARLIQK